MEVFGKESVAVDLLDRLRKEKDWMNCLLEACQHPELNLEHLAELVRSLINRKRLHVSFFIVFSTIP